MGIKGLDALKEGDDRKPEDTSADTEHVPKDVPPEL